MGNLHSADLVMQTAADAPEGVRSPFILSTEAGAGKIDCMMTLEEAGESIARVDAAEATGVELPTIKC